MIDMQTNPGAFVENAGLAVKPMNIVLQVLKRFILATFIAQNRRAPRGLSR